MLESEGNVIFPEVASFPFMFVLFFGGRKGSE
jgi:hypothetical protein